MSVINNLTAQSQSPPWSSETTGIEVPIEASAVAYIPPEQLRERSPRLPWHAGRVALGVLLSTVALTAENSTVNDNPAQWPIPAALSAPEVLPAVEAPSTPHEAIAAKAITGTAHSPTPIKHTEKSLAQAASRQTSTHSTGAVPKYVLGHEIQLVQPYRVRPNNANAAGVHHGTQLNWVELDSGPDGLYEAQFNQSDQAQVLATTVGKDLKGRIYAYLAVKVHTPGIKPFWECGWAVSDAVTEEKGDQAHAISPNPCVRQIGRLANPFNIGHDFNCPPGKCSDGTYATHLTPECNDILYRNDAALDAMTAGKSLRFARSIKHPLYDPKQKVSHSEPIHYRFVPNEDKTIVVRSNEGGWSLMTDNCAPGHPKGGPPVMPVKK